MVDKNWSTKIGRQKRSTKLVQDDGTVRNREDFKNKVDKLMLTVPSSSNRSKQPRTVGSSRSSMMYYFSALSNSGSEIEPEPSLSKNWRARRNVAVSWR